MSRPWTPLEDTLLKVAYKRGGPHAALSDLRAAGYTDRTLHAVRVRAGRIRSGQHEVLNGRKLTPTQRALLARFPLDATPPILDVDFDPLPTRGRKTAVNALGGLARRRLVEPLGDGLYRLTLRGLIAAREGSRA